MQTLTVILVCTLVIIGYYTAKFVWWRIRSEREWKKRLASLNWWQAECERLREEALAQREGAKAQFLEARARYGRELEETRAWLEAQKTK